MKYIKLTDEELLVIQEMYKTNSNSVVRERSLFLLLSSKTYSMVEIQRMTGANYQKIQRFFKEWESAKISSLPYQLVREEVHELSLCLTWKKLSKY